MTQTDTYHEALALIDKATNILITTHTKPDGDACGSVAAMTEALRGRGKTVQPVVLSPVPSWYSFLVDADTPVLAKEELIDPWIAGDHGTFDLVIIVDTNSCTQLPRFERYLKETQVPVLVFDHHVTSDGLGQVEVVDTTASATGLILVDFLTSVGWPITLSMAEALFIAIATDTGWFQFNNTDGRTHRHVADLIDLGIKPAEIYDKLFRNFSFERFKLMMTMLDRLELHLDGRYAVQYILDEDFARTGASYQDTENLINECHRIASVAVSVLLVELKDGRVRCSLRSRGSVNVSEIATKFGGGGHKMAAGTFLPGPIENAKKRILDEVTQRLSD